MKHLLLTLLSAAAFFAVSPARAADTYAFDPNHTNIVYHVNHFGFSNPSGHFGIKQGTLMLDEEKPQNSIVNVTIDVNSILTGVAKLDEHLKTPDFFDTAKYPTAFFRSKKITVDPKDKNAAKIDGDLTIHGVTKPVTLDAKLNKIGVNPIMGKKTVGFSGSVTIKRSDFGINKYVPDVSDEIKIDIEAEANLVSGSASKS